VVKFACLNICRRINNF